MADILEEFLTTEDTESTEVKKSFQMERRLMPLLRSGTLKLINRPVRRLESFR
jgi:hypothetical protein